MITSLGLIAGSGVYPLELVAAARKAGVKRIVVAAFENETPPILTELADEIEWMRVGQLGRMLTFFQKSGVKDAMMAGQIAPKNLFDFRPDFKALLLLATIKERNAETLFGAIANEMVKIGITILPATTYMENSLAPKGHIAGPEVKARVLDDLAFGLRIAKEISRMDIGQTIVVRNGTVLAVEAFEGTNETLLRGGALGKKSSIMIKVSKPNQDFRFDVPVIGMLTLETAQKAGISVIGVEAGKTLMLEKEQLLVDAERRKISLFGL